MSSSRCFLQLAVILITCSQTPALRCLAADTRQPLAGRDLVFAERAGLVAVEAEHFVRQAQTETRAFHLATAKGAAEIVPDGDPVHVAGASSGAYLEILPDSRRNHSEKLIAGENFSNEPGKLAVLTYRVHFSTPGRYYVWARAYSSGSEDNGLHVGIDGIWPESGRRMQWCEGKNSWWWESKQRTASEHCGVPYQIYLDVEEPGVHEIHFSMREDGFEFDKWLMTTTRELARPVGVGPDSVVFAGNAPEPFPFVAADGATGASPLVASVDDRSNSPTKASSSAPLQQPRQSDGDGSVQLSGEPKQWHKLTLTQQGPFAHEKDNRPNPFTDHCMQVTFTHTDGTQYVIPGYFAADGKAAESSAESGTSWRVHFAPDRMGTWTWKVSFRSAPGAALYAETKGASLSPYDGVSGTIEITASEKTGRDLRAHGRLQYVGKHYLQHAGSKKYFLKAGADAPETLLGYADFDNTIAGNPTKAPLKTWQPHVQDWQEGDPSWKDGKGKGLIGAINYLAGKGCNAFSFLTYNAGGDGDNVWPFIQRDDKLHYDCSKLDQWGIVFDHGTARGMYLHFKMQETENDDHNKGTGAEGYVPECLDGGNLGDQRRLYCRELIARFGHNLALNWNLGEENTQSTKQQVAMIDCIAEMDAYQHNIVTHTYPSWQERVYRPLLGDRSRLTGVSLQNDRLETTHAQTIQWVRESAAAGKPWIVAFDESGSAAHAQCPDLGYQGFDGHDRKGDYVYTEHKVRKQTLWGHLMGGGAGNEYYFGYQFVENDIVCEDWRSRDRSWDYCRYAINFFQDNEIPFWEMTNADELVGNPEHDNSKYCFAKPGQLYLVYLPEGGTAELDLNGTQGDFSVAWFNPRTGGPLKAGSTQVLKAGTKVAIGTPPSDQDDANSNNAKPQNADEAQDWLAVVKRN